MGERTEAYAQQFEDLSRQFITEVEGLTPDQMQATCEGEQCTVAALAAHIAGGHPVIADWVATAAAGGPMPAVTMDDVNAMNAKGFARDAERAKDEILVALRENGAQAASVIRSIDDEQLDQSVHFDLIDGQVTPSWLIEKILINELVQHPASIRAACERTATTA